MRKGEDTRNRLLDAAEAAALAKGLAATSIEELIAEVGITKSGFFYHFKDKNALARALLKRYIANDEAIFDGVFGRAAELMEDPLQAFLLGLKLLAELLSDPPKGRPGLAAVASYSERLFDPEIRSLGTHATLLRRRRFHALLQDIAAVYPPRQSVDLDQLADMVSTVLEGGIIIGRALGNPRSLEQQILVFRSLVKAMFQPGAGIEPASPGSSRG